MKTFSKALAGTIAAGAMAVASMSPAYAASDNKIGAGEVIAGALVIGGIAAIAASGSSKRDRYGYGDSRYRNNDQRHAVDMCVRAAESRASRNAYGRSHVTDIRKVDRKRDGYNIEGRITVNNRYSSRRGDNGTFKCKVRYGRVSDLSFRNIRGL